MEDRNQNHFDIIVAGAGLAGVLCAARLREKYPDCSILLLDKNSSLGGRLRGSAVEERRWSYGLQAITPELFHFWDQTLKQDPEAPDLQSFVTHKMDRVGVLAANKVTEVHMTELVGVKGARAVAGGAGARDWKVVEQSFEKIKRADQSFASVWGGTRKSPSALVMEHLAHAIGIPDIWDASAKLVMEKALLCNEGFYCGNWEEALAEILNRPGTKEKITVKTDCRIVDSKFENNEWLVQTAQGPFQGSSLVVAQPPWEAILWLPKNQVPDSVLVMANKTKPVSVVVLSEIMLNEQDLPEMILVPAEEVQIVVHNRKEIYYQATLDYEITMQAPEVVKAVKRLRRAKKKLQAAYPELKTEGDHLSLLPVGWSQPTNHSDRRWLEKLDEDNFQAKNLVFCGDSYGPACDGDKNIVSSINAAIKAVEI